MAFTNAELQRRWRQRQKEKIADQGATVEKLWRACRNMEVELDRTERYDNAWLQALYKSAASGRRQELLEIFREDLKKKPDVLEKFEELWPEHYEPGSSKGLFEEFARWAGRRAGSEITSAFITVSGPVSRAKLIKLGVLTEPAFNDHRWIADENEDIT